MENNKWKKISAVLAVALILSISYSPWKQHQIEKELLNEFVLNVSTYAQYALPAIEKPQFKIQDLHDIGLTNVTPENLNAVLAELVSKYEAQVEIKPFSQERIVQIVNDYFKQ
ncbi:hypothetical protein ACFOZY_09320 [Chungangia koreensis]|uniref:Uncharacterized protein n=1 Tax=Chungangia koreensis TaxID=752657 RepID=A0ABV8X3W6_9LACT